MVSTITTSDTVSLVIERDFSNFFVHTYGAWKTCDAPDRRPDWKSPDSLSKYWDCGDRVIRKSDHWGIVGSCFWKIDGLPKKGMLIAQDYCGYILYKDFGDSKQERQKPWVLHFSSKEAEMLNAAIEFARRSPEFQNMEDDLRKLQGRIPYSENFINAR